MPRGSGSGLGRWGPEHMGIVLEKPGDGRQRMHITRWSARYCLLEKSGIQVRTKLSYEKMYVSNHGPEHLSSVYAATVFSTSGRIPA